MSKFLRARRTLVAIVLIVVVVSAIYLIAVRPTMFQQTNNPIVLGTTVSLTGAQSDSGRRYALGLEAYVRYVNEVQGGLLGRPVKLIIYDDKTDTVTAKDLFTKLIDVDKVDALAPPYSSLIVSAVAPIAERNQMLLLGGSSSSVQLYHQGYKWLFSPQPALNDGLPRYFFQWIEKMPLDTKPKTIAIVGQSTGFGADMVTVATSLANKAGLTVVLQEKYPTGTTDFVPLMTKVAASQADVLYGGTLAPDTQGIVKALAQIGYNPKAIFMDIGPNQPDFYKTVGKLAEGVMGESYFESALANKTASAKTLVDIMDKWYLTRPSEIASHTGVGWGAMEVLVNAIRCANSLDQSKMRDCLLTHKFDSIWGSLGPWNPDGTLAQSGVPIIQWINGAKQIVLPEELATAQLVYPKPPW